MSTSPLELENASAALLIEALKSGQEISFFALGGSMRPLIPHYSKVTIQTIDPRTLRWGEVALTLIDPSPVDSQREGQSNRCTDEKAWVLHRVLRNDHAAEVIYTAGDRLPLLDPARPYSQVVGVLVKVEGMKDLRLRLNPRSLMSRSLGMIILVISHLYHRFRR